MNPRLTITFLLAISAALLASLIPGGPIENRDFSAIHPVVLAMFNVFLTALDIVSLVALPFTFRGHAWANKTAFVLACGYFVVYATDLAQLFPRSPTTMSPMLALIEVVGMTVAVLLMFASRRQPSGAPIRSVQQPARLRARYLWVAGVAGLTGLAIVVFATHSAMNSGSLDPSIDPSNRCRCTAETSTHYPGHVYDNA